MSTLHFPWTVESTPKANTLIHSALAGVVSPTLKGIKNGR